MLPSQQVVSEILKIVADDPTISNPDHISVTVVRTGPLFHKREEIHLGGTAKTETDRRKVEEVAGHYSTGRTVVNEIRVAAEV